MDENDIIFDYKPKYDFNYWKVLLVYLDYNIWYFKNRIKAILTRVPNVDNWGTVSSKVAYGIAAKEFYQATGKLNLSYDSGGYTDEYMEFQDSTLQTTTKQSVKEAFTSPWFLIFVVLLGYLLYSRRK